MLYCHSVVLHDEYSEPESKQSELFLLSESENFYRISDSENDSLEFVSLQPKFLLQEKIKSKYLFNVLKESI